MPEIICENCSAAIIVPEQYDQPYIKCSECGGHQKSPLRSESGPKYRILDASARARSQDQELDLAALSSSDCTSGDKGKGGPASVAPAIASAARKAEEAQKNRPVLNKVVNRPVSEEKMLEDVLGKNGMDLVFQTVAGYMGELNEKKRIAGKARAVQALMRMKIPAELAARAVDYAEKSPVIETILWSEYRASLIKGLGIFLLGVLISAGVHALAHPRWEFVLFQIPFAVGFAFAANAGINMAGLKIKALRNEKVHYAFVFLAIILITAYVVAGIWF
jgi:hypothetical protein